MNPSAALTHICLKSPDLAATERFYSELLGFPRVFTFTRKGVEVGFYLQIADRQFIEVFADDAAVHQNEGQRLAHFCLETDDIAKLHGRLKEAGLEPGAITLGCDQSKQFWVQDPHGIRVEFQEFTENSAQLMGGVVEVDW